MAIVTKAELYTCKVCGRGTPYSDAVCVFHRGATDHQAEKESGNSAKICDCNNPGGPDCAHWKEVDLTQLDRIEKKLDRHSGAFIKLTEVIEDAEFELFIDPLCIKSFGESDKSGLTAINLVFGGERIFTKVKDSVKDIAKSIEGCLKLDGQEKMRAALHKITELSHDDIWDAYEIAREALD